MGGPHGYFFVIVVSLRLQSAIFLVICLFYGVQWLFKRKLFSRLAGSKSFQERERLGPDVSNLINGT